MTAVLTDDLALNDHFMKWENQLAPVIPLREPATDAEPKVRLFYLFRDEDATGVSGTGVVAWGIEYPDGFVSMRWCVGFHKSTSAWESIDAVRAIHGHDGMTHVVYLFEFPA